MKKILSIIAIFAMFSMISCSKKGKTYQVKTYITTEKTDSGDETFIYWYLITSDEGRTYYTESRTPLSAFTDIDWSSCIGEPKQIANAKETEPEEITENEMSEEMAEESFSDAAAAVAPAPEASENGESDGNGDGDSDSGGDSGDSGGGDGGGGD